MTHFDIGDTLRARAKTQGLLPDLLYKVVSIKEQLYPFGNYVTYTVINPRTQEVLTVRNGHVVFTLVRRGMSAAVRRQTEEMDREELEGMLEELNDKINRRIPNR